MGSTRYFTDQYGEFVGSFADDAAPPEGAVEVPTPPPDGRAVWGDDGWSLPIGIARADAKAAMRDWIDGFLEPFTAGRPRDEIASWPAKAPAAESHLAGKPSAMILAEAAVTGENPDELALSIAIKAGAYMVIAAKVAGLRRATEWAINAATSQAEIAAALDAAKAAAVAEMAAITAKQKA